MKTLKWTVVVAALTMTGMSCNPECIPGEQQACSCTDGREGAQTCNSSGTRFGTCTCSTPKPPENTGGGGGQTCGSVPPGATILNCNCLTTPVTPGSTVTATGCSSCRATMLLCNPNIVGLCAGGGIPWGNICN